MRIMSREMILSIAVYAFVIAIMNTPSPACAADEELTMRNGARISAPIVKETTDDLFVDIGARILSIPKSDVLSRQAEKEKASAEATPAEPEAATAPGEGWQAVSLAALANRTPRSSVEALDQAKQGVAIVSTPSGFGAGFFVDLQGQLITNQHVVLNEKYVDVTVIQRANGQFNRKKIKNVELVAMSPLMDIALLKIPDEELKTLDLKPLPLAAEGALQEGDTVFAIGNPGMGMEILDHTLSEGIVSSLRRNFDDVLYIQTTAAVNPGNSGGPLINAYGEVAGLVSLKASFQEGIAFALPVEYIRFFLKNQKAYAYGKANPNTGFQYLTPD